MLQIALHWLGTGEHHSVDDIHGVSRASICRAVREVVAAAIMGSLTSQHDGSGAQVSRSGGECL